MAFLKNTDIAQLKDVAGRNIIEEAYNPDGTLKEGFEEVTDTSGNVLAIVAIVSEITETVELILFAP